MPFRKKNPPKNYLWLSTLISRVFDPIVVIPVVLSYAVWNVFVNGERIRFLIFLLGLDVLLPAFILFYFIQGDVIRSGWDVRNRAERVPLFIFVVLSHGIAVLSAYFLEREVIFNYLFSFWILTALYAIITLFWKISVHVGVIAAFAIFMVLQLGVSYSWLYALVLIMIWARVYGEYHQLTQAIAGALVPTIVLPCCFYYLGLW